MNPTGRKPIDANLARVVEHLQHLAGQVRNAAADIRKEIAAAGITQPLGAELAELVEAFEDAAVSVIGTCVGVSRGKGDARSIDRRRYSRKVHIAREMFKPSPVRLGHIPNWFRRSMLKAIRSSECRGELYGSTSGWDVFQEAPKILLGHAPMWADHVGSTSHRGQLAFCSEPYGLSEQGAVQACMFADALGIRIEFEANSFHSPGSTIRILFLPADEGDAR